MITEEQKFRAETFRILGIALITPFARFILDPYLFLQEHKVIYTIFYIIVSTIAAVIGFIHIEFARGILDEKGLNKWIKKPQSD